MKDLVNTKGQKLDTRTIGNIKTHKNDISNEQTQFKSHVLFKLNWNRNVSTSCHSFGQLRPSDSAGHKCPGIRTGKTYFRRK